MTRSAEIRRTIAWIAELLERVHTRDQSRRDSLAQLRFKYAQLARLRGAMREEDLEQFKEIGKLIRALEITD